MFIILAGWLYLFIVFFISGWLFIRTLSFIFKKNILTFNLIDILWCGIIFITIFSSYLSLFFSINKYFHITFIISIFIFFLFDIKKAQKYLITNFKRLNSRLKLLYFIIIVFVLGFTLTHALRGLLDYDAGLYHIQAIKWIKNYPVVPGLGNLHGRLAYNSLWFVTHAFFDLSLFSSKSNYYVNSFVYLITLIYLISSIIELFQKKFTISRLFNSLLIIPIINYTYGISSLQPNYIITLILLFLCSKILSSFENKSNKKVDLYIVVILASFAITVKLHAAPFLLLIPLTVLIDYKFRDMRKLIIPIFLLSLFILLPWLTRNVILSGWLVYPFPHLDIFNFDWKIPKENVKSMADWTRSWAMGSRQYPDIVLNRPFFELFKISFNKISREQEVQRIILLLKLNILNLIFLFIFSRSFFKKTFPLFLSLLFGLIFWISSAPSMRFGLPYVILSKNFLIFLIIYFPLYKVIKKISLNSLKVITFILLLILIPYFFIPYLNISHLLRTKLREYPKSSHIKTHIFSSGLKVNIVDPTKRDQCWDSDIPCMPGHFIDMCLPGPTDIELRKKHLRSGFRVVNQLIERPDLTKLWWW